MSAPPPLALTAPPPDGSRTSGPAPPPGAPPGLRPGHAAGGGELPAPTIIGTDVVLGSRSVVFRSLLRNGTVVGVRSAVVGSRTALDQVIGPRTTYANDTVFGPVEW